MAAQTHEQQNDDPQAPDAVKVSPTGAVMGKPGAEHGAYGMVRDDAPEAEGLTERAIRGVEPAERAPRP